MQDMFSYCEKLTSIDVSKFNTEKVTSMEGMFQQCECLTEIDLINFNTENVTSIGLMFAGCDKLTSLDLSSFNTQNVINTSLMFKDCINLSCIVVGSAWNLAKDRTHHEMFSGCSSLVGSNGTTYNAAYVDKTYARVDGGASSPGYLTLKVD